MILDPYVRVAFGNSSQATEILLQTLCPTWDQTLIFESVPIYGNVEEVQDNPPHVVLEFFDRDAVVSSCLHRTPVLRCHKPRIKRRVASCIFTVPLASFQFLLPRMHKRQQ